MSSGVGVTLYAKFKLDHISHLLSEKRSRARPWPAHQKPSSLWREIKVLVSLKGPRFMCIESLPNISRMSQVYVYQESASYLPHGIMLIVLKLSI